MDARRKWSRKISTRRGSHPDLRGHDPARPRAAGRWVIRRFNESAGVSPIELTYSSKDGRGAKGRDHRRGQEKLLGSLPAHESTSGSCSTTPEPPRSCSMKDATDGAGMFFGSTLRFSRPIPRLSLTHGSPIVSVKSLDSKRKATARPPWHSHR